MLSILLLSMLSACITTAPSSQPSELPHALEPESVPAVMQPDTAPPAATEPTPADRATKPRTSPAPITKYEPILVPTPKPRKYEPAIPVPPLPGPPASHGLLISHEEFIYANDENLLRVYPGLSMKRVISVMSGYRAPGWRNPCGIEKRIDGQGQVSVTLFYLTRKPTRSRPLGENRMTPVIIRDGRVDTFGRYRLKKLRSASRLVEKNMRGCPF